MLLAAAAMWGRETYAGTTPAQGWRAGMDVGAVSPLKGRSFFGNMRPSLGFNIDKRLTPAFALGVESQLAFNTSRWPGFVHSATAVDRTYLGLYGDVDFLSLGGSPCRRRPMAFGIQAGCGWGHDLRSGAVAGHSWFGTKAGMYVRFNITRQLAFSLAPSVMWNMSDARTSSSSAAYSGRRAMFGLQAGLRYSFGPGFECGELYAPAEIDALNTTINDLRAERDNAVATAASASERADRLAAELAAARARKPEVVKEVVVDNRMNTVLDVFFLLGSARVTPDQLPNVERIAAYLKNHPQSRVVIKGYASRDGNRDANLRLAEKRAQAVRSELMHRYGIAASRITAEGAGIGDLFEEDSWNRVSVCTLEN